MIRDIDLFQPSSDRKKLMFGVSYCHLPGERCCDHPSRSLGFGPGSGFFPAGTARGGELSVGAN